MLAQKYQNSNILNLTESQEQILLKKYTLKHMTYKQIYYIYKNNAMSTHFELSKYSAISLVCLPGLTNLYYTFKPHGTFSKVAPFAVPFLCLVQYGFTIKHEMENFCFIEGQDSEKVREKVKILSKIEFQKNQQIQKLQKELASMDRKKKSQTVLGD